MRTFVVLIPIEGSIDEPKEFCEFIMGDSLRGEAHTFPTAQVVLAYILEMLNLDGDNFGIEVMTSTCFAGMQNDGDFDSNKYYMSIVYM